MGSGAGVEEAEHRAVPGLRRHVFVEPDAFVVKVGAAADNTVALGCARRVEMRAVYRVEKSIHCRCRGVRAWIGDRAERGALVDQVVPGRDHRVALADARGEEMGAVRGVEEPVDGQRRAVDRGRGIVIEDHRIDRAAHRGGGARARAEERNREPFVGLGQRVAGDCHRERDAAGAGCEGELSGGEGPAYELGRGGGNRVDQSRIGGAADLVVDGRGEAQVVVPGDDEMIDGGAAISLQLHRIGCGDRVERVEAVDARDVAGREVEIAGARHRIHDRGGVGGVTEAERVADLVGRDLEQRDVDVAVDPVALTVLHEGLDGRIEQPHHGVVGQKTVDRTDDRFADGVRRGERPEPDADPGARRVGDLREGQAGARMTSG